MEKCERCSSDRIPVAEYTLQKCGYARQVVLCEPCRDATALIYPLEAVKPEPVAAAEPEQVSELEAPEAEEEAAPQPTRRGRIPRRP